MMQQRNTDSENMSRSIKEESISLLEWKTLKLQISHFALTSMGKKSILEFEVPASYAKCLKLLNQTIEINKLEEELNNSISFSGVSDIKNNVKTCSKGGVINAIQLLEIADTISASRYLNKLIFNKDLRPNLSGIFEKLIANTQIEKALKEGIESNGRISDNASDKLRDLRQQVFSLRSERRKVLDTFIQRNINYLQDTIIGDRYGRPVVAIKVNYLDKFHGVFHDSSASGSTLFLEPDIIVQKGNKIASLEAKVAAEEHRLISRWSDLIGKNTESLILMSDILLEVENALIRSRYSNWIKGKPPKVEKNPIVSLIGFSHPLLIWEYKKNGANLPTPIDFRIGRDVKVVAITGPNTGGKTIALKGLGIALLMARSGLFIPSEETPIIPFCPNIYADIGDNQSLQENLSTFSGHINRIKEILDSLDYKSGLSIVLLDEIGSGTDPTEGTALSIALLRYLAEKSDLTMITTHYGEIKSLKYSDNRFENVSVSFDDKSLKPTYKLNWGIPGRSNALSISKRIGLNEKIISEASELLRPKQVESINNIIKGLEEQRIRQQNAAEEAAELIARSELLHDELKKNYEYQKLNAEKFQAQERKRLSKNIKEAQLEVTKLIKRLRDANANGEDSRKIGIRLKEIGAECLNNENKQESHTWNPVIGDYIRIKSLNTVGEIIDRDENGLSFEVKCGSFRSTLSINELEGLNGEKPKLTQSKIQVNSKQESFSFSKIRTSKNTIDVRGFRVHEAEIIIEEKMRKFHGPLWIIHGIGSGKLKKGLRNYLLQLSYVEKIEDARKDEGGPGCSIVWIK